MLEQYLGQDLDLGSGVSLRFTQRYQTDEVIGAIIRHPRKDTPSVPPPTSEPGMCEGSIWFVEWDPSRPRPLWQVVQEQPLTLTPSILCHCGLHGFVTNGSWIPA